MRRTIVLFLVGAERAALMQGLLEKSGYICFMNFRHNLSASRRRTKSIKEL